MLPNTPQTSCWHRCRPHETAERGRQATLEAKGRPYWLFQAFSGDDHPAGQPTPTVRIRVWFCWPWFTTPGGTRGAHGCPGKPLWAGGIEI